MIVLDGSNLTIDKVIDIVNGEEVKISDEAMQRLHDARKLVFDLVDDDVPIYGFNVGVGWNKDKAVFKEFFQEYNRNVVLSHCVASGEHIDEKTVRAVLALRLNSLLVGCVGTNVDVPIYFAEFLNKGIHPCMPIKSSVGVADIGNMPFIGLNMIGEGECYYKGEKVKAADALKDAGLAPLELGPKDGLALVSSNAFAGGLAVMLVHETRQLLKTANLVFSLSLEGFDGNMSPFEYSTFIHRPYAFNMKVADEINKNLKGSEVYETKEDKPVQDPLSYRDVAHVHGALLSSLEYLEGLLTTHLNSTEDNPCLLIDERRIISCANFEPIAWVLATELLGQSLTHVSKGACHRMIKLLRPQFSRLPRYLAADDKMYGLGILSRNFSALDTEVRLLSNPVSSDFYSLEGDVEDRGNNSTLVVKKTLDMVKLINQIFAMEAYLAAQAVDLRDGYRLGEKTKVAYEEIRKVVPFYDKDRNISEDIEKMVELIESQKLFGGK